MEEDQIDQAFLNISQSQVKIQLHTKIKPINLLNSGLGIRPHQNEFIKTFLGFLEFPY